MDVDRAKSLLEKHQRGLCSQQERDLVESVFDAVIDPATSYSGHADVQGYREELWKALSEKLSLDSENEPSNGSKGHVLPRLARLSKRILPYAAATLVAAVGATWLLLENRIADFGATIEKREEILPGGNRATLTLANGRVVDLDENQAGIVINEGITYLDGSQVMADETVVTKPEGSLLHSITTPKGGTYQITLPDGSQVWLNAASTLKYPGRFAGDSREVFLEGEGFFAISRQQSEAGRLPFRVVTAGQTVEVLGTEFNLSAYADDYATKTTLVQGKVKVTGIIAGEAKPSPKRTHGAPGYAPQSSGYALNPGQQAITRGSVTTVQSVDVMPFTAWKDGIFYFEDTPLVEAMNQLSRWYDVKVVYAGKIPQTHFYGQIGRGKTLSEALAIFAESGVKFRVENHGDINKLIVLPR